MSEYFDIDGDKLKRDYKNCPKHDGKKGFKMAEHDDRYTCGVCGHTDFK